METQVLNLFKNSAAGPKRRGKIHPSAEKVHFQGDAGNSREQRRGQKKN
jgi:hypothetical protein